MLKVLNNPELFVYLAVKVTIKTINKHTWDYVSFHVNNASKIHIICQRVTFKQQRFVQISLCFIFPPMPCFGFLACAPIMSPSLT